MASAVPTARAAKSTLLPMLGLFAGAIAMGISPVFVRLAELGPFTSAFWRVALAIPPLWIWARMEGPAMARTAAAQGRSPRMDRTGWLAVVVAGLFFAGDLTFWHLAILHTTVANATFLATLSPVWVVLASGLVLREAVSMPTWAGLLLCLVGAGALVGETVSVSPEQLGGDLYGIVTSVFFAGYFLAIRPARLLFGAGRTLFLSTIVTALVMLVEALAWEHQFLPVSLGAAAALVALALFSQVAGQGLLSYALGHLPAAFSSLVLFVEGVAAAALGWAVLGELVSPVQAVGAVIIFAGIIVARPRRPAATPGS
ncbi:Threonine/homoserine efflux transporter RhtA [Faunimonas pinastri]|uniref:Threonine/homoserine efflux transporter RhtA n=1 Tax=Faunimonas pinastri TaxID=1855383 RepID=A0A1H8Z2B6_9HYPH|nr:DMT family transporter [Faunimonas pinastri]SEP58481.1 Threonine/homoserine efflux transporter RhtA [Faunimonas pinastri]